LRPASAGIGCGSVFFGGLPRLAGLSDAVGAAGFADFRSFSFSWALAEQIEVGSSAKQPGVEKVEDRPEIAGPVLDRRARQNQTTAADKRFDRVRLSRAMVFDRLRLVENNDFPGLLLQRRLPGQIAVGGYYQIIVCQTGCSRWRRRVLDAVFKRRREASDLVFPVAEQGSGHNQQMRPAAAAGEKKAARRVPVQVRCRN